MENQHIESISESDSDHDNEDDKEDRSNHIFLLFFGGGDYSLCIYSGPIVIIYGVERPMVILFA